MSRVHWKLNVEGPVFHCSNSRKTHPRVYDIGRESLHPDVSPTFGCTREQGGLNCIESPVKRGSRRTRERTAITGPLECQDFVQRLTCRCAGLRRCALASI